MEARKLIEYARYIFCWDCVYTVNEVKSERIGHLAMLLTMTVSLVVVMHPSLEGELSRLPCCRNGTDAIFEECEKASRTVVVLRFSFVYVLFFLVSFMLELTTRSFEGPRYFTSIFWFPKFLLVSLGCFGSVYIPPRSFDKIWTVFLGLGSVVFIVAQVYTIVRLSYVLIITLHKMEERGSKSAYKIQIILFVSGIVLSVVGEAMLIYYYPLCSFNLVFLITNALFPAVACLWSVSDCVKARNGYSGFIQGSILNCFVVYYTWSAITNEHTLDCNPYFKSPKPFLSMYHMIEVILIFAVYILNTNFSYALYVDDTDAEDARREESCPSESSKRSSRQEYKTHVYNSLWCSFLRPPIICFIVMTFMEWSPKSVGTESDVNKTSTNAMWFKLVGCWLSIIFFIITLYVPAVYGVSKRRSLLDKH